MMNAKVILNASLDNIARGIDVEENVSDAAEVIAFHFKMADKTLLFMRGRPNSRFLQDDLACEDLHRVGLYTMGRKKTRQKQVISFEKDVPKDNYTVKFFFRRTKPDVASHLVGMIKEGRTYSRDDMTKVVLGAVLKRRHPHEALLGDQARTLDAYVLSHVDVVRTVPLVIFGYNVPYNVPFISSKKRDVVYREKS